MNTAARKPGRPRSGAVHQAIIAATLAELDAVGYGKFTIEGVAARAGSGKATIYRYWRTKQQLVTEALLTTMPTADKQAALNIARAVCAKGSRRLEVLVAMLLESPEAYEAFSRDLAEAA